MEGAGAIGGLGGFSMSAGLVGAAGMSGAGTAEALAGTPAATGLAATAATGASAANLAAQIDFFLRTLGVGLLDDQLILALILFLLTKRSHCGGGDSLAAFAAGMMVGNLGHAVGQLPVDPSTVGSAYQSQSASAAGGGAGLNQLG